VAYKYGISEFRGGYVLAQRLGPSLCSGRTHQGYLLLTYLNMLYQLAPAQAQRSICTHPVEHRPRRWGRVANLVFCSSGSVGFPCSIRRLSLTGLVQDSNNFIVLLGLLADLTTVTALTG